MRGVLVALAFIAGLVGPAMLMAQAPPPVPAMPDSERRTEYTITGSNCNCPIGFTLYGDATDFGAWIEVYLDGVKQDPATYSVTSPSGSLATLPRPITDAILSFTALTTGEVQIVGGRRPRRTQLFSENRGVAARDLNQVLNDVEAQNREAWDMRGRTIRGAPGTEMGQLPSASDCANGFIQFDATGQNPTCVNLTTGDINTITPGSISNNLLANMPPLTVKCNPTAIDNAPDDCVSDVVTPLVSTFSNDLSGAVPPVGHDTVLNQVFLRGDGSWTSALAASSPILTLFTSGHAGVFTPSVGTLYLGIEMCGGGGGGGGTTAGTTPPASDGAVTYFGKDVNGHYYTAAFGASAGTTGLAATLGHGGRGGATSGGDINLRGATGDHQPSPGPGAGTGSNDGGNGAASAFGGGGSGGFAASAITEIRSGTAAESFCAGGGGGSGTTNMEGGGGGGAGGYLEKIITQPLSADYLYGVGDGGSGGPQGTGGGASGGASAGNGVLMIMMFFQ